MVYVSVLLLQAFGLLVFLPILKSVAMIILVLVGGGLLLHMQKWNCWAIGHVSI